MRTVKILFGGHLLALLFGLGGLLIALPHPELWAGSPTGVAAFTFGIRYAGSLHILFGAATMLLFGLLFVGVRKTLIFFFASTTISLSMELLGTSTGLPFGPYAYTDFLGYKILGHVPYSIPLSWFYMGFTSYVLASLLVTQLRWRRQTLWSVLLGVYFLTVWDLTLDPAMVSNALPVHFWVWYTSGPYFGMPISNLLGWSVTGLIFMSVGRLLWRSNLETTRVAAWLPFGVYLANTCFAIVLTLSTGIWQPSIIAIILGLLPAVLVFLPKPQKPKSAGQGGNAIMHRMSHLTVRTLSEALVRRNVACQVEGLEHLPERGPLLIVARHFHHLYDGCLLLSTVPRRLHILIGLDWIQQPRQRWLMEWACHLVDWPIVLRSERLSSGGQSAYQAREVRRYLRRAVTQTVGLLRQGETLVIFPEAYPTIDPAPTPRGEHADFLPFRPGFAQLVRLAEKDGHTQVAIVPAGLDYVQQDGRWQVTLRFDQALSHRDFSDKTHLIQTIEQRVHELSAPALCPIPIQTQEALSYETDTI